MIIEQLASCLSEPVWSKTKAKGAKQTELLGESTLQMHSIDTLLLVTWQVVANLLYFRL